MADRGTIDLAAWYSVTPDSTVFQNALREFSTELSNDPEKLKWIVESKHGNVEAVLAAVQDARQQYKGRKGNSKAAEALTRLSEKIHHYGGIVDVVVSHHPEYTALVWGAMKFFFVGVVNHQKVITRLSEGLVQIADLIPTADLTLRLYPLPHVRKIVVAIHANILRFLVRALRWYQESKLMHVVHAITRPTELRYDDILLTISALSRSMSDAALASSQAEQRDMHLGILQQSQAQEALQSSMDGHGTMLRQLATAVADARGEQSDALAGLQQLIQGVPGSVRECLTKIMLEITAERINTQVIHESANVHLHHQLSTTQVATALNVIAVSQLPNPTKAYQTSLFFTNMRRARPSTRGPPFWLQDGIQQWNAAIASSLVVVNGTKRMRFHLQWFCAQSIAVLRESGIAVVWALKTIVAGTEDTTTPDRKLLSSIDVIKYLVSQVVMVNKAIHNDAALTSRLKSFSDARSEEAWIGLLAAALRGLPRLYVVLDADIMSQAGRGTGDGSWPAVLSSLFARLSDRDAETVVKVILVSSGPPLLRGSFDESCRGAVVTVGRARQPQTVLTRLSRRGGGAENLANADGLNLSRLTTQSSLSRRHRPEREVGA